jgi:hypothetical protein
VVQKTTEVGTDADEVIESIANQAFLLFSNLLMEEARRPWNKILEEQIDCSPWIDYAESNTLKSIRGHDRPSWTA